MRKVLIAGTILLALGLAACGDTEGGDSEEATPTGGDGGALEVVAHDIGFDADSYETSAGDVELSYVNEGAIPHTLVIEGVDGFKLEVASEGDEDSGSVSLEAGSYVLFCDVPGHRDAGMEATLEVG